MSTRTPLLKSKQQVIKQPRPAYDSRTLSPKRPSSPRPPRPPTNSPAVSGISLPPPIPVRETPPLAVNRTNDAHSQNPQIATDSHHQNPSTNSLPEIPAPRSAVTSALSRPFHAFSVLQSSLRGKSSREHVRVIPGRVTDTEIRLKASGDLPLWFNMNKPRILKYTKHMLHLFNTGVCVLVSRSQSLLMSRKRGRFNFGKKSQKPRTPKKNLVVS